MSNVKVSANTDIGVDDSINLSNEVCPMTFVLTKMKLDALKPGQHLEVVLPAGEPVRNVSISVKEEGHKVLKVEKMGDFFRLIIEKG
ncbi:MAG TPA: sulfurtransferase TusA family protein [Nitrospinae bacterium]|nr:sulfurtransferase TusA family protein [Nitrospinota bacterium]HBA25856.1 sulfurtransferase TusA family protein [Nitrospinota bacterium]